ncbi:DinB family protein [Pedobacter sp. D749]|uniref:DinB family protein n=1 Tax=Pedobacter sp. D749 TaxID=2856523 RepID=UPI001C57E59A|nr:DinB family protein [Pedobacter sp. D749]QXU43299.1 DinB family protein [Pedobacter sp. D749]
MKKSDFLANRLKEIFLNGYWIANTNYRDQLEKITWQQAIHQVENLNTIAALTYHINYYLAGILTVFNCGLLEIKDQYSFDLPPIHSEADWNKLASELFDNASVFAIAVEKMPDEKLDEIFVNEKYGTYLRNLEAVIEHSYYHLGQIVLIKKLILAAGK